MLPVKRKPRAGVDVDGVICNLHDELIRIAKRHFKVDISLDSWDFDSSFSKEDASLFCSIVGEPGLHSILKPYKGALQGMMKLQEVADVYIVTSHLSHGPTWVHERDRWIQDLFQISDKKIVHTKAKYTFFGDILVDDKPSNCESWSEEHNKTSVLWAQPYNEKHQVKESVKDKIIRTNSWSDVVEMVRKL